MFIYKKLENKMKEFNLIENQVVVVAEDMVRRHTAAGQGPDNRHTIGTFKVGFDCLVVTSVARNLKKKI